MWLRTLAKWVATLAIWGVVGVAVVIAYFAYTLPDVSEAFTSERQPRVVVLADNGQRFSEFGQRYEGPVPVAQLPSYLPQAVLATEDRRFYSHFGLDPLGLARAMVRNVLAGRIVQGGSTITQQVAKNLFLSRQRTLGRKIRELLLALWLERNFTKDQILTLYLNRVYLGAGTYGVEAAAQRYFDKSASRVTLYEAAVLAGLLKAPSRYNPASNADLSHGRASQVLYNMVAAGYLTAAEAEAAIANRGQPQSTVASSNGGRYFTNWAIEEARDHLGVIDRDITLSTTVDPILQRFAETALRHLLDGEGAKAGVKQGAIVVMSPDGAVRALVGGKDYRASQFNRAVQALRQPGSSFKPFVYLAGLEQGLTPNSEMVDEPITIAGWSPGNYDDRYRGPMTLRQAMALSVNTVAVKVAQRVGPQAVVRSASRLGITSPLPSELSLALGTAEVSLLEITSAYATFANAGQGVFPHAITAIRDGDGASLYQRQGGGLGPVISANAVRAMHDLLSAVIIQGTGQAAKLDRPAAGKSGTSQDNRDAWFIGYTADYVAGVWLGNDDGKPMDRVGGSGLPARLWRAIMTEAHRTLPPRPLALSDETPRDAPATKPTVPTPEGDLLDRLFRFLGGNP